MQNTRCHDVILSELDIRADPFALCTLEGMCSLGLGRTPRTTLHYILSGTGELAISSERPIPLSPGTLVLVPASLRHSLIHHGRGQSALPTCAPAGLNLEEHLLKGEGEGDMLVLCSTIRLSLRNTRGLIDLLRDPLSLNTADSPEAASAVKALMLEMSRDRIGRHAMIRVLLLQCVIELFRYRLEAKDPALLWMSGLADPNLWKALRAMLEDPGASHSVESLAEVAGLSRSRFAELFQDTYQRPPMTFLRELRLAKAAQSLCDGREPISRIAQKAGFTSRSAFTRAFAEAWGQSPRSFRLDHC